MPKTKPVRQCVACRTKRDKSELLRIVRGTDGALQWDGRQKMPGRGAYLCRNASCVKRARKTGALSRALKTAVPESVWHRLEQETEAGSG